MPFFNLFRRRTEDIFYTRVLVCSIGLGFEADLVADFSVYKRHFDSVLLKRFKHADELLLALADKFDIVHVLATVDADGHLGNGSVTGSDLIAKAASWDTKLLWMASANDPQGYISGWKAQGSKLNLVMTIDRGEVRFTGFLDKLLAEMKLGSSMPVAWNRLAPQVPGRVHPDAPATIFYCGRGQVRFL